MPRRQRKRIGFDTKRWRKYAALFTPDDSDTLTGLQEVIYGLGEGSINSTQAVDRIGNLLYGAMRQAFGVDKQVQPTRTEHAPW
jgi:hypothetical protein